MVGEEEIDTSYNMVRYKEKYFIFHYDQRLKEVPREVFSIFVEDDAQNLAIHNPRLPHLEDPA